MTRASVADLSQVHVVVPARGIDSGKSRLGEALDAEERGALVLGLLERTLAILDEWPPARRVHLVTPDARTAAVAGRTRPTLDSNFGEGRGDLNGDLLAGALRAASEGATAVLMLAADLPLLNLAALDALLDAADAALAAGDGRPLVVIAPSDARVGTNALLLSPVGVISPQFGESSLEAHLRAAAAADASVQIVIDPTLGFDLDTPEDLERLDAESVLAIEHLGAALLAGRETIEFAA